jgi:hypothetical protein
MDKKQLWIVSRRAVFFQSSQIETASIWAWLDGTVGGLNDQAALSSHAYWSGGITSSAFFSHSVRE